MSDVVLEEFLAHYGVEDNDLKHYGVKGMKWGVIREQQAVISKAEHLKKGTTYKEGSVIEGAKFVKAYANKAALEAGDFQRKYVMAKAYLEGKEHTFKKDPTLSHAKDVDALMKDVVKQINPDFGENGTKLNCRRCTFAYEMRRRGMDVKATNTSNASGQHLIGMENALTPGQDKATRGGAFIREANKSIASGKNPWGDAEIKEPDFDFKAYKQKLKKEAKDKGEKSRFYERNVKANDELQLRRADNIRSELAKQGEGARGELGLAWMLGGGHSVAYEVVKGNPVIFDTQSGEKFDNPKALTNLIDFAGGVSYTRLDNKPLNEDYLRRWVQDA